MATVPSHLLSSNVLKWSVDDVSKWLGSLSLGKDYSAKLKGLLIDGQVLCYSDCNSLISLLGITSSNDRDTFSLAHNKLPKGVPFQSPPTSSPGSATSFSSSLTSPISVSPINGVSPEPFHFPVCEDGNEHDGNRMKLKSKSLDELLNTVGYRETILTTPTNQSSHLFDMLRSENIFLKKELEYYYERVSRLQKLDLELQQLQDSYRLLEGASHRKARLEKSMRERLEEELLRMKVKQTYLKDELHSIKRSSTNKHHQSITEIKERESTIDKLTRQNEEAIALRLKLENNLNFTKSALEQNSNREKRKSEPTALSHISRKSSPITILDHSDNGRKHPSNDIIEAYISNLEALQSLLTSMQMSSDKRQQLEQQLRKQLEDKVKELEEGKSNSRGKTKNDQQIIIATLQADLAQMEQKYTELLAEKQLSMTETRQSHLCLLENDQITQQEELKTVKSQRDKYMKQLEQANQKLMEQGKRIRVLESIHGISGEGKANIRSPVYYHPITTPLTRGYPPLMTTPTTGYHQSSVTTSNNHYQPTTTTTPLAVPSMTTPPTLPSYDEHLQHSKYIRSYSSSAKQGYHGNRPPGSHSFPNTPETVRRQISVPKTISTLDNNGFLCSSSPAGSLKSAMKSLIRVSPNTDSIYKSLTPPPMPLKQYPPAISGYSSQVTNGHAPLMIHHNSIIDTSDSIESLDRSPSSLSPPTRYQIGRNCHSFGSSLTYDKSFLK